MQFKLSFQFISKRDSLIVVIRNKFFFFNPFIFFNPYFTWETIYFSTWLRFLYVFIFTLHASYHCSREWKCIDLTVQSSQSWRVTCIFLAKRRCSVGVSLLEWYHLQGTNSTRSISAPAFRIIRLCQVVGNTPRYRMISRIHSCFIFSCLRSYFMSVFKDQILLMTTIETE